MIILILLTLIAAGAQFIFAVNKSEPYYRAKIVNRAQPEPPEAPEPATAAAGSAAKQETQQTAAPIASQAPVAVPPAVSESPPPAAKPQPQPQNRRQVKAPAASDPYEDALDLLGAERYQAALEKFKAIAEHPGASPHSKEKALRRIADCWFYLGFKGSNQELLKAADLYKELIKEYPGSREENAISVFRQKR